MIYKVISVVVLAILNFHIVSAQMEKQDYPVEGEMMPNFNLTDVDYYMKKQVSLEDFKGKWLILDFWTKGCISCVESFPKINQLQEEFKEKIQFLLIAKNDEKYNKNIRGMYEKFRKHQNLELPVAYDTTLFNRFGISGVPLIIIIDPEGIVRGIRSSSYLDTRNLQQLITKGNFLIEGKSNPEFSFDKRRPFLVDGNGGKDTDFLYRSILSEWDKEKCRQSIRDGIDDNVDEGCFQVTGALLRWLYNYAYFGTYHWYFGDSLYGKCSRYPIFELSNLSPFRHGNSSNENVFYSYSLIVPEAKATKWYLQEIMQNDLKNYFGYEVTMETRNMPYWKLTATSQAINKLKTNGQPTSYKGDHAGFTMINFSISEVLKMIQAYHPLEPAFIDETDIAYNIDITVDAILTDLESIKKELQKNGLNLIKGTKEMKVLVIKEDTELN